jgi:thiamine-monophosphate kinase
VGEAGLLDLLLTAAGPAAIQTPGLVVGPGDDAAVWTPQAGASVVVTQDALVEGIDYRPGWTTPYLLGRRALVVSLSDLAAMGATPHSCLATVCASPSTVVDDVAAVQLGLMDAGSEGGCPLLGGDVSAIEGPLVVDVCALGTVQAQTVLRRGAGRVDDLLVVTGVLGRAAAGLRILLARDERVEDPLLRAGEVDCDVWLRALLQPDARLAEGRALAAAGLRCAGDISDGLLVDAERTAASSGCAAEIWLDRVPVDAALRAALPDDWAALAIAGGEDFELLATANAQVCEQLLSSWALTPLTVVGRLVPGRALRLLASEGGSELERPAPRSRHFA